MPQGDEVEFEVCCDGLEDALNAGCLDVVDVGGGVIREVVSNREGTAGIAINFCPFCGEARIDLKKLAEYSEAEGGDLEDDPSSDRPRGAR